MAKVAIVIGATGLIGKSLVKLLAESETIKQVITFTRSTYDFKNAKVLNHVIDFNNLSNYQHLFQGDMLFSCLGSTLKQAKTLKNQYTVDVEYQLKIATMSAENGVKHYLLASSSGANEHSKNAYLQMKGTLEKQIIQLNFEKISIFQPSLLTGNRLHLRLAERIGAAVLPLICLIPGLQKYRPILGSLVAQKMLQVSQQQQGQLQYFTLDQVFPD
jgi:uncharacterized protein YbjT (DUF2867 family)